MTTLSRRRSSKPRSHCGAARSSPSSTASTSRSTPRSPASVTSGSPPSEEHAEAMLHLGRGAEVVVELAALVAALSGAGTPGRPADARPLRLRAPGRRADGVPRSAPAPRRGAGRGAVGADPDGAPPGAGAGPRAGSGDPRAPDQPAAPAHRLRRSGRRTRPGRRRTDGAPAGDAHGVGGVGKSRLAVEVAAAARPVPRRGVALRAGAAGRRRPGGSRRRGGAAGAAAARLSIERDRDRVPATPRSLLLVLDNCEHVLDDAARLARPDRRASAPGSSCSRPAGSRWASTASRCGRCRRCPSLTRRRCSCSGPRRRGPPTSSTARPRAVAAICRRLDGLPLAIELAAARMRAMSEGEIAERLDDARLLAGGVRAAQPRHQSLAAAIDWSYRLLSEPEQQLFARLSVFAGGADLAAVHAVCAEAGTPRPTPSTCSRRSSTSPWSPRSACRAAPATGCWRPCAPTGGSACPPGESLARRHAEYYVELAERAARGVQGRDERDWVERTLPESDNLRAAFERAFADRDVDLALRLVTSLPEVTHIRVGYEAAAWAERALDQTPPKHPLFVAAVGAAARGAWNLGDFAVPANWRRGRGTGARTGNRPLGLSGGRRRRRRALPGRRRHRPDRTTPPRSVVARRRPTPSGWCGRCTTSRSATPCAGPRRRGCPPRGMPAAGGGDRQPAAHVDGPLRARPGPEEVRAGPGARPLRRGRPARGRRANFWWEGIALMEAAATRGVHGDPQVAAAAFLRFSTTGTGSATGPSSGSTCATSSGSWSGSAPMTRRCGCTTACSPRASRHRWTPPGWNCCSTAPRAGDRPKPRWPAPASQAPTPSCWRARPFAEPAER